MQGVRFEKVSRFKDIDFPMPVRKTAKSAGYDLAVAEAIVVPSQRHLQNKLETPLYGMQVQTPYLTLDQVAKMTKEAGSRPTLVSTGVKCYLPEGYWLQLVMRSSGPLKYWLLTANAVGVIDADYVDNPDNEGEIFFQIMNLSPAPILLQKGDIIGQGIVMPYTTTENDIPGGARLGGMGSTSV